MQQVKSYQLRPDQPFNLDLTLQSGQAFRWTYDGTWWIGYISTDVIHIHQNSTILTYYGTTEDIIVRYFSLDQNLSAIYDILSIDHVMKQAITSARGLRLIRQEPWECIVCHICSNRSQRISATDRITRIAEVLGTAITIDNELFFLFPTPSDIINASSYQIRNCNLGHSTHLHLIHLAELFVLNQEWVHLLNKGTYHNLIQALHKIGGVSKNAAEYIAFSAFGALEAFPVDSHIRDLFTALYLKDRIIRYPDQQARDHIIQQEAQAMFGCYAAYAFEYLFMTQDILKDLVKTNDNEH